MRYDHLQVVVETLTPMLLDDKRREHNRPQLETPPALTRLDHSRPGFSVQNIPKSLGHTYFIARAHKRVCLPFFLIRPVSCVDGTDSQLRKI